ncbi:uncharacterized protein PAC_11598 [Phialocephala subalpina]|uniref:Uncharacterized protein n=1 Tax=Phialocephala subalpina TaxID=576137 RepID=A0A1L7X9K3_9HELO|nr:uncharacterized protein PAC_11598 [Phialocephala subalpina]
MKFVLLTTYWAIFITYAAPTDTGCKQIQYQFPKGSGNAERAEAVADAYRRVYSDYAGHSTILKPCLDTPSGVPAQYTNVTSKQPADGFPYTSPNQAPFDGQSHRSLNTAVVGTLVLEYYRLSDLTGDTLFKKLADKAEQHLIHPNPAPKYPGLYLIKTHIYGPREDNNAEYAKFRTVAADSSAERIAVSPYDFPNLKFLSNMDTLGNLKYSMDDYVGCQVHSKENTLMRERHALQVGASLHGGAYLCRLDLKDLGVVLTDSYHQAYNTTVTGLGPRPWESNMAGNPADDNNTEIRAYAAKNGYFIPPESFANI